MSLVSSARDIQMTVQNALQQAQIETVPFRYWDVQGLLPEEVRKEMLDIVLPRAENFFCDGTRAGDAQDQPNDALPPKRMFINNQLCDRYPFFAALKDAMLSDPVLRLVQKKFGLDARGLYLRMENINDYDGFYLAPHRDIGEKKLTLFYYLNNCPEHLGTDFYDKDLNWVKSATFAPNRGYLFIPADDTWHGLEKKPFEGRRAALLINYVSFPTDFPVN
jgi:hypothetical protein